jgi:thioredoxin 1
VPVYVYCLSGGRSQKAAEQIRALGIVEVYELEGGFLKWKTANKKIEGAPDAKPKGALSGADINAALKKHQLLILDFSAAWCGPCIKMQPTIAKIQKEMPKVKFLVVDADANQHIVEQYAVDEIPTFLLFKNGKQVMHATGYMDEAGFKNLINQNL